MGRARTEFLLASATAVVMLGSLLPTAIGTMRDAGGETLYVRAHELNARDAPAGAVIGWLACGDQVEVIGENGDWRQIRTLRSDAQAWVTASELSPTLPSCNAVCLCQDDRDIDGALCGDRSRQSRTGGVLLSCQGGAAAEGPSS